MNFKDLMAAKMYYEKISELCDTMGELGLLDAELGETKLHDVLRLDVASFIMYLSASDGRISQEEAQAFRTITGFNESISGIVETIKEHNIYSMDFESEPPFCMKLVSEIERRAVQLGAELTESALPHFVNMYELIGNIVITVDGGVSYTEKRDFGIIMDTIRGFANDHNITGSNWSLLGD